ncbi:MAG: C45 family peptidase [Anaerolineales bacterium]|jgi:isopenicillin-N N-acyltransferase-like protein|nr:C45 family peptidase [Anaerolineales bacterium]
MLNDPHETPIHREPVPMVRVSGSHREVGRQIGEAFRGKITHSVENARNLLAEAYETLELTWDGAKVQSRKYLPFSEERFPQYVDEIRGMAEGANVDFYDLVTLNTMEAVTTDALHLTRCTSMAVNETRTANGHVLAAHNEDWVPEDEDDVYIVHASLEDEPPFLAMNYGGLLPNVGFNADGIAQLIDSVYPSDSRIGIPRLVIGRAVLAARKPDAAIRWAILPHRAAGYNHLIVHESGEIYSVEVSAQQFDMLHAHDGYMVHTNHYLAPKMHEMEKDPDSLVASRVRYYRASRLLRQEHQHTLQSLQSIQKDHVNFSNSICSHAVDREDALDREKTINALVIDLTAREMHIAWGNPCLNAYHTYHLDG